MSKSNTALTLALFGVMYAAWRFSTRFMSEETERIVMFGFASLFILVLIVWGFTKTGRDARSTRGGEDHRGTGS